MNERAFLGARLRLGQEDDEYPHEWVSVDFERLAWEPSYSAPYRIVIDWGDEPQPEPEPAPEAEGLGVRTDPLVALLLLGIIGVAVV